MRVALTKAGTSPRLYPHPQQLTDTPTRAAHISSLFQGFCCTTEYSLSALSTGSALGLVAGVCGSAGRMGGGRVGVSSSGKLKGASAACPHTRTHAAPAAHRGDGERGGGGDVVLVRRLLGVQSGVGGNLGCHVRLHSRRERGCVRLVGGWVGVGRVDADRAGGGRRGRRACLPSPRARQGEARRCPPPSHLDRGQPLAVDALDDLHVPRQQLGQHAHRPLLERLGHHAVEGGQGG